jgi:membrane-associated phospholipid phosphatase
MAGTATRKTKKMRIRSVVIALAALAIARLSPAQSVGNMLKDDFKNAGKDVLSIWGAPFDASGRDWATAAGAFALFGVSMFADQEVSDWAVRNEATGVFKAIKPLRRGGVLFSGKYVVPPVAAMYVVGIVIKNQGMRDFVTGCMSSWGAQSIARRGTAFLFGRARPDTFPNDPQHWKLGGGYGNWQMRSFPAGHFANAMSCATFASERFELGVAEPVLYAVAAGVGLGRFADEAHWFSDTVIGGILGYAVGKEVARRSLSRHALRKTPGSGASLGLSPSTSGMSMTLNWRF